MVKYFDEPKKITLREFFEDDKKRYIQKFEYCEYGNWEIAIIKDINLSLRFTKRKFKTQGIYKAGDWEIVLEYTFMRPIDYMTCKSNPQTFTGYTSGIIGSNELSDIYNYKIEVHGLFVDD